MKFSNLKREYVYQKGYGLADLKNIAYALDISLDELDPTQYIDYPELYISKLIEFKNKIKMAEKPEVIVWKVNLTNIKYIEPDLSISLDEINWSIDTKEEFEKIFSKWFAADTLSKSGYKSWCIV